MDCCPLTPTKFLIQWVYSEARNCISNQFPGYAEAVPWQESEVLNPQ